MTTRDKAYGAFRGRMSSLKDGRKTVNRFQLESYIEEYIAFLGQS